MNQRSEHAAVRVVWDQIAVNGPGTPELEWVKGIPIGDHVLVHYWRGAWTITHRPTGCAITTTRDGQEGVRLAQILVESGAELGDAYDRQAIEEIRGAAESARWKMAEVG